MDSRASIETAKKEEEPQSSEELLSSSEALSSSSIVALIKVSSEVSSSIQASSSSSIKLTPQRVAVKKPPVKKIPKLSSMVEISSSEILEEPKKSVSYCINSEAMPETSKEALKCSRELWNTAKVMADKGKALHYLHKARKWHDNGSIVYETARINDALGFSETKIITLCDVVIAKPYLWSPGDKRKAYQLKIRALTRLQKKYPSRSNKKKLEETKLDLLAL